MMQENTVISLNASVAHVDVYVELSMISINVTLSFGPFNRISDAREWADALEQVHAQKQPIFVAHEEEPICDGNEAAVRPYIDMHMSVILVEEHKHARKLAKHLFAPDAPEKVEPVLAKHALAVANEAITNACLHLAR